MCENATLFTTVLIKLQVQAQWSTAELLYMQPVLFKDTQFMNDHKLN